MDAAVWIIGPEADNISSRKRELQIRGSEGFSLLLTGIGHSFGRTTEKQEFTTKGNITLSSVTPKRDVIGLQTKHFPVTFQINLKEPLPDKCLLLALLPQMDV